MQNNTVTCIGLHNVVCLTLYWCDGYHVTYKPSKDVMKWPNPPQAHAHLGQFDNPKVTFCQFVMKTAKYYR